MSLKIDRPLRRFAGMAFCLMLLAFAAVPAMASEYAALEGVKGLDSVFDFTLASPSMATIVLPAIKGVHEDKNVRALAAPPRTVIVFHGGATKLISTDRTGFDKADYEALDKVAELIRQYRKDGIKMEVCMYAVKVLDIDPATLMPEIDQVGNGFISVLGYQAQGYSLVTVP
jgi:intracellular sulfur oxidation DsrE/DsrF family protein